MNQRDYDRTVRNVRNWDAFIAKMEARESLTTEQGENLEMRMAQVTVWRHELREAEKKGLSSSASAEGDISAQSGATVSESVG